MGMRVQFRRAAIVGALCVTGAVLGQVGPAAAIPPGVSQAAVIVGAAPTVVCPPSPQVGNGSPTSGGVTVTNGVATCNDTSAVTTGSAATGPGGATFNQFQATCTVNGGTAGTAGSVTTGAGDPLGPRTVVGPTTYVVGGFTYSLNEVSFAAGVVTRTAIHVTGPGVNTFVGQVQCASLYPLAVDSAAPAAAAPAPLGGTGGGGSSLPVVAAAGIGALILAQVGLGLWLRRRRTGLTA